MQEFEPKRKNKILTKEFIGKYAYVLVLAVLLIGGISYGYTFFIQNKKITSGSITTAALTINFTDRTINATNLSVPTTDQDGLIEFSKSVTITNQTAIDGRVKLTLSRTSGLALSDLRYAIVVNGAIQEIADVPSDGVILSSAIMGNESVNVEVRLWPKTTYSGSETTFVGELTPEIKYLGPTAADSINSPAGKYVNFNCSSTCEVWQIVKVEDDRLVLTRQADYTNATSRTNSNKYNPTSFNPIITFNDDSMITSLSTDGKNVYLAKTVKIDGGSGTQADPYTLINNDFREPNKKVIAQITYKDDNNTTVGTQSVYYNETNYVSQTIDSDDFEGWTDGTNTYYLGSTITVSSDTILTAIIVPKLRTRIMSLCNDSNVDYVQKYDPSQNGAAIDKVDGSGNEDVCYYTSTTAENLAGQNGNVIFGDYCWQIVRTTTDGGVKLVYNGPKTNSNTCPNDNTLRPSSLGAIGAKGYRLADLTGSKTYGTSFEIFDDNGTDKFRLKDTHSYSWSDSTYQNIVGKYICGTSSAPTGSATTCEVVYYVGNYQSNEEASVAQYTIDTNTHFSQVGKSVFNTFDNSASLAGYMYNDTYNYLSYDFIAADPVLTRLRMYNSTAYYYGTSAVWNSNTHEYDLKDNGNPPSSTITWQNIHSNAAGKYTCLSSTDTSCSIVYYIAYGSTDGYMYYVALANQETINDKTLQWTYGTGYSESNGEYTLTGNVTSTTIQLADWPTAYTGSEFSNVYVCPGYNTSTCNDEVYHVVSASLYRINYHKATNNYIFGKTVTYSGGSYTIDTSQNSTEYQQIWDWAVDYNKINSSHYTCFKTDTDVCGNSVYFVYYTDTNRAYYIELKNGEKVTNALQKMFNTSNSPSSTVNRYNSAIKSYVESWYESNLSSLTSYVNTNTVYCGERSVLNYGGWSETGNTSTTLQFKYMDSNTYIFNLGCTNTSDRFSTNNSIATLTYPVGLLTFPEQNLMRRTYVATNNEFWVNTPRYIHRIYPSNRFVRTNGAENSGNVNSSFAVRPVITLKPGTVIMGGNGGYTTPYVVDTTGN